MLIDFHADTYRPKCGMLLPDYISDEGELKDYLIGTDKYNLCLDEPNGEVFDITVENYKIGEKTL